jgi:hypothetical protein
MARARLAPVDAEATGERESRSWAPSALVIVSDAGAASFAAAKEGITEVGEEGGSGVVGGVRPARERRLLERGEGDRARPRPRRTGPARSSSPPASKRPNPMCRGMPSSGMATGKLSKTGRASGCSPVIT